MATFYLPNSGYYSTGQTTVRWRIKITENYTAANGKRLYCQVLASRTNSASTTDARGSVIFYLDDVQKSSASWAMGDKPITSTAEVVMASCYITLSDASTSAKITAQFSMPGINVGTQTNGGTVSLTKYTISYNANSGSNAPSSQTGCYKNKITLSKNAPVRQGYKFLGWSTSSSATQATYLAGGSYTITESKTLYAVYDLQANCYVKQDGKYVLGMLYIKQNGVYKNTTVKVKNNGTYKNTGL